MLKIEKVLYPTDLSRTSLNAIPMAAHLAKIHGADLHMLHVYILHSLVNTDDDPPFPGEEEARRILEESVPEFSWSRVFHNVRRATAAAPAILGFAEAEDVDLIVMASHGRRGIRRMLLGSVAEEVVRLADRPVLVIRDTETLVAEKGFQRVLVPVDFSNHADTALRYGRELAATWNAELDIIHILERPQYSEMQYPQPVNEADLRAYAEDRMKALLETHSDSEVKIRSRIVAGYAADEIVSEADRLDGTLVVMPSHGLRGMERLLLGSVTERVLRRAQSPVMVLRAAGQRPVPNNDSRMSAAAMSGV
jgi:nucleotide-binding universal stress UspA family protein